MSKYFISTNQLAEYSQATEASKKRIIKQQKVPNKLLIPWYQKAKGAIKKFFSNTSDYAPHWSKYISCWPNMVQVCKLLAQE
ncbi:MAG: hypothetical protein K2X48_05690 [Chitinophagaceae bacterium]|nr:hypothetical protein [Chitinophagaceae bacterium]